MFQFAQRRKLYFLISSMVIIPGLIAMIYSTLDFGSPVKLSIDFTGGTLMDVSFVNDLGEQEVRDALDEFEGVDEFIVQELNPIETEGEAEGDSAGSRWLITIERVETQSTTDADTEDTPEASDAQSAEENKTLVDELTAFLKDPEQLGEFWSTTIDNEKKDFVTYSASDTGGVALDVSFANDVGEQQVRDVLDEFSAEFNDQFGEKFVLSGPDIQRLTPMPLKAGSRWQIRVEETDTAHIDELKLFFQDRLGEFWTQDITQPLSEITSSSVSATVGKEVTRAAFLATLAVAVIVLGFIVFAFRKVPQSFRYGACAITAMFHDILITMGIMSILGLLFGWEVDALFLTAILTVVGFSVQDSIVVFDRIRENIPKYRGEEYDVIVNRSVLETVHRSLATQLNAVFIMVAILLFGGETIRQFIAILLIGLMSGTYSSIFNAVPLLVAWEKGEIPFVNREAKRQGEERAAAS